MRIIIFLLLLSTSAIGQVLQETNGRRADRINIFKEGLRVPIGDTASTPFLLNYSGDSARGGVVYDTTLSKLCFWTGIRWVCVDDAGGGGSGTVTSVATGLGLSGGTITTTGTIVLDTASSAVLSRQRAANTYALIGASPTGAGVNEEMVYFTGTSTIDGNSNFKYKVANNVMYFGGVTPAAWNSAFNANLESNSSHIGLYNPGGVFLNANAYFDGTWKYKTTAVANHLYLFGGELKYRTAASGSANAAITWVERLHMGTNGRLGINTTTPAELLHVRNGRILVENSTASSSSEYLMNTDAGQIGGFSAVGSTNSITHWRNNVAFGGTNSVFVVANSLDLSGTSTTKFISLQPGGVIAANQRVRFYDAGTKFGTGEVNSAPDASALIEMESTTKGLLLPRMTTTQRDAITAANGLLIYNTTASKFQGYAGGAWVDLH